jgi:hypothetical protein
MSYKHLIKTTIMDKKRLEEIKVMIDNARKNLAEKLKSIREQQEHLRKLLLVMETLDELLEENADFKKKFESKLAELIQKKKLAEGEP